MLLPALVMLPKRLREFRVKYRRYLTCSFAASSAQSSLKIWEDCSDAVAKQQAIFSPGSDGDPSTTTCGFTDEL